MPEINEEAESVIVENEGQDVTDAELNAAFQDFMGDNLEPEVEPVVEPTVPDISHPDSSRIGRKVKFMEQQFNTKFSEMSSKLDSVLTQLNRKEVPEKEFDEFGVEIQNPVDIEKLVTEKIVQHETEKQKQSRESVEKYQTEYVSNLRELINEIEDPVIARQVFKKMVEPGGEFNIKLSDNAYADCSKNFIRAIKAAATPFSGKRGASVPIGVDVPSQNTESQKPMPKLDPEAEEYAKSMGMSVEEVSKVLDGDIPLHLRGSKKVF